MPASHGRRTPEWASSLTRCVPSFRCGQACMFVEFPVAQRSVLDFRRCLLVSSQQSNNHVSRSQIHVRVLTCKRFSRDEGSETDEYSETLLHTHKDSVTNPSFNRWSLHKNQPWPRHRADPREARLGVRACRRHAIGPAMVRSERQPTQKHCRYARPICVHSDTILRILHADFLRSRRQEFRAQTTWTRYTGLALAIFTDGINCKASHTR